MSRTIIARVGFGLVLLTGVGCTPGPHPLPTPSVEDRAGRYSECALRVGLGYATAGAIDEKTGMPLPYHPKLTADEMVDAVCGPDPTSTTTSRK